MSRKRGRVSLVEYAGMARRVIRAYGERFAEEGDEPELRELVKLRDQIEMTIEVAVNAMYARGDDISWTRIGDALGMTREGARVRYSRTKGQDLSKVRAYTPRPVRRPKKVGQTLRINYDHPDWQDPVTYPTITNEYIAQPETGVAIDLPPQ